MAITWKKLSYEDDVIKNSLIDAAGDLIYGSADNTPAILTAGSNTHVLTLAGGVPTWAAPATPSAHAASHQNGGGDEISVAALSGLLADDQHVLDAEVTAVIGVTPLNDLAAADGAIACGGQQLQNPVIHQVADAAALGALDPVVGKLAMQIDTLAAYICTEAA
jgi:hypothetical protein